MILQVLHSPDRREEKRNAAAAAAAAASPLRNQHGAELRLPLELIERIISLVEDRKDLRVWALSCTTFRGLCQRRMFGDLTVSCDYTDRAFREGGMVYSIAHGGDDYGHITASIKRLKIENRYAAWSIPGGGKTVDGLLGRFVKKLKAVERLEINGAALEWKHREFVDGLMVLLQVPTMRELNLRSLEYFPLPVVFWGRTLKKIELERVLFTRGFSVGFEKPPVAPVLEEVKMINRKMGLFLLRTCFFSDCLGRSAFAGLKKLQLDFVSGEGDTPNDISTLLTACEDSLEHLELFIPIDAYGAIQVYKSGINLGRLRRLQSFSTRLYLTTRDGYLDALDPFAWLRALFADGPPSVRNIHLTFFHRFGDIGNLDAPEKLGWSGLDLALDVFKGLKEVTAVICCTQCKASEMKAHEAAYDIPLTRSRGVTFRRIFTKDINCALDSVV